MWNWEEWKLPALMGAIAGIPLGVEAILKCPNWLSNCLWLAVIIVAGVLLCLYERFLYRDSFRFGFVATLVWTLIEAVFKDLQHRNNPDIAELDRKLAPFMSHSPLIHIFSYVGTAVVFGALVALPIWGVVALTSFVRDRCRGD